jgi:hypothetical protein
MLDSGQLEDIHYSKGQLDFDGVDPDLGMHLLSLHWNRQHHSFLITYRPAFMRDMACGGPYFSKLLLNAIYFGSSKFSPRLEVRKDRNDVRTAGWRYRERVRELLGGSLDRSDITTIQALLVMTNSLFALGDERSAAWLYAGLAFRMLIDLGLHVDLTNSHIFSDEDLEIRRRVFWGAFGMFLFPSVQSLMLTHRSGRQDPKSVPRASSDSQRSRRHGSYQVRRHILRAGILATFCLLDVQERLLRFTGLQHLNIYCFVQAVYRNERHHELHLHRANDRPEPRRAIYHAGQAAT